MINGINRVEWCSMRSVYVQSKSLVRRGVVGTREYMVYGMVLLAVDSVGMGSRDGTKVGVGHVRQEHHMHEFTSTHCIPPLHPLRQFYGVL